MNELTNAIKTWDAFRRGEDGAFQRLYSEHYVSLINYCYRVGTSRDLANDIVIETLLNLWDKRSKLPKVVNIRSYLISSVHSTIYQNNRADNRRTKRESLSGGALDSVYDYEDYFIRLESIQQFRKEFQKIFASLTARQKEVLELRFFMDMDYDEIAQHCGITKRTAYNTINGALSALKKAFEDSDLQGIDPQFLLLGLLALNFMVSP